MIRRTFLKAISAVFLAATMIFPPLVGKKIVNARETCNAWQIFVPSSDGRGPIVDNFYSTEEDAIHMAKAFACGSPFKVFPQEGWGVHNRSKSATKDSAKFYELGVA